MCDTYTLSDLDTSFLVQGKRYLAVGDPKSGKKTLLKDLSLKLNAAGLPFGWAAHFCSLEATALEWTHPSAVCTVPGYLTGLSFGDLQRLCHMQDCFFECTSGTGSLLLVVEHESVFGYDKSVQLMHRMPCAGGVTYIQSVNRVGQGALLPPRVLLDHDWVFVGVGTDLVAAYKLWIKDRGVLSCVEWVDIAHKELEAESSAEGRVFIAYDVHAPASADCTSFLFRYVTPNPGEEPGGKLCWPEFWEPRTIDEDEPMDELGTVVRALNTSLLARFCSHKSL